MTLFPPPPPNSEDINTIHTSDEEGLSCDTVSPPPPPPSSEGINTIHTSNEEGLSCDTVSPPPPPPPLVVRVLTLFLAVRKY